VITDELLKGITYFAYKLIKIMITNTWKRLKKRLSSHAEM